jgi:hypothetical protein
MMDKPVAEMSLDELREVLDTIPHALGSVDTDVSSARRGECYNEFMRRVLPLKEEGHWTRTPPSERWKIIPGFPGYMVSNAGRVLGIRRNNFLSPCENRGYFRVNLYRENKRYRRSLHRLVLIAFRGDPGDGQECAHLDGNRKNNRLDNLVWVSRKENASHRLIHGTDFRGEKSPSSKLNDAAVQVIRAIHKRNDKLFNSAHLGRAFGVHESCILKVVGRETWTDVPRPETLPPLPKEGE